MKISIEYSHEIVSQVTLNSALKTNVNDAAAASYRFFFFGLLMEAFENLPAQNMEMPLTIAPQYKDTHRPGRSKVKFVTKVEKFDKSAQTEISTLD